MVNKQQLSFNFRTIDILFLISILLCFVAYFGGLTELVTRWNKQEEYGHGFFIPLISLWFLWHRKEALIQSVGKPSRLSFIFFLIAILGLVLGEITAIFVLIQFGFIFALMGCVLAYGGASLLKVTVLPILFLIFAIPLPYFVDAQLSWRLQIISSDLGVGILRLLGNSVYLEGNVIDLGVYKLQVVEACSGLRYLYPLLSIGFLMAYMYKASFWKRALIFLSSIPITVVMNSVRIAMVGLLVNKWGIDQAEGFAHYFEGWIIFMICLLILVAEILLFEKLGLNRSFNQAVDVPDIKPEKITQPNIRKPYYIILVTMTLIGVIFSVNSMNNREEIKPDRKEFVSFPLSLDGWKGKESNLSRDVYLGLKLEDYLLVDYKKPEIGAVNFYIAYYASQRKGASPHSPEVCMPGGGWIIASLNKVPLTNLDGKDFSVNRAVITKDNYRQVVYYWFEQRGRRITNQYMLKWYLLIDALKMNRTDGALVRVTAMVKPDEPIEVADKKIESFLKVAMPHLKAYVPE